MKVVKSASSKEFEKKYFYMQVPKKNSQELKYGDMVQISGEYSKPSKAMNYGGFDYQKYLKTKKIYGIIETSKIDLLAHNKANLFMTISNSISSKLKENIDSAFKEETAGVLKGLLLGDTSNIEEEIKEDFRTANMSHILAISGMHISYITMYLSKFLEKKVGKRSTKIIVILVLIVYMFIKGFSPSVVRAVIMGILAIGATLVYRKNDFWTSISISLFILLAYNPYLLLNIGLQFSYLGTVGIIIFYSVIFQILDSIHFKKPTHRQYKKEKPKVLKKVEEILAVSLSAQIAILPVMLYHFNIFGPYFILSNFLISIIIGPIILFGFVFMIISLISLKFANLFAIFLEVGTELLINISKVSNLPFSKIYVATPKIKFICIYFILAIILKYLYLVYHVKQLTTTQKRVRNLMSLLKYKINLKRKKYLKIAVIAIAIFVIFNQIPKDLKIHFVSVGQGDCTFIVTPKNQTILIDGGGSEFSSFDVGKSILLPYILDRGYNNIDYVLISHFDSDHVGGILSLMEEIKVKNLIISKQGEVSENYQKFLKIVNEKKINLFVVGKGDRIKIENQIYFDILWPAEELIDDNVLNNNSMVAKFNANQFSMLFTGDIEDVAEKEILKNVDNEKLKATVLKVAHHGSKTSSTEEFLEAVAPKAAFIGVGENNKFGHPNLDVLTRLTNLRCENL